MNSGVLFGVSNLWHFPDSLDDGIGETNGVAFEMSIVCPTVEVVFNDGDVEVGLQHDGVRIVEGFVLLLGLEGVQEGGRERRPLP